MSTTTGSADSGGTTSEDEALSFSCRLLLLSVSSDVLLHIVNTSQSVQVEGEFEVVSFCFLAKVASCVAGATAKATWNLKCDATGDTQAFLLSIVSRPTLLIR